MVNILGGQKEDGTNEKMRKCGGNVLVSILVSFVLVSSEPLPTMSSHCKNNACLRYDNDDRYRDRERDRLPDDNDRLGERYPMRRT